MATREAAKAEGGAGAAHVALLRGVNVGGNNRLPMQDLVSMFEAAGCTDVETYIQSGNVIFTVSPGRAKGVRTAVERALYSQLGNHIAIVVRTAAEFRTVVRANPFLAAGAEPQTLHVAFLLDAPAATRIAALEADRFKPDAFAVRAREIYLHYPNGLARSKLTNSYFDRTLKTTATVRNWRTVLALLERATK